MKEVHRPVMAKEVLHYLELKKNGVYIDCTVGSGGHSRSLLENCPDIKIIAFDQDQEAIVRCQQNLFFASQPITFINDNFVNFPHWLKDLKIASVDGFLFDLGVSSEQLNDDERGFSYQQDTQLDMRMDKRSQLTAQTIINNYSYQELVEIFSNYGEARKSKKIAWQICQRRAKEKIITTQQLAKIVVGCHTIKQKKHPARQIFQALRIAVNQELANFSLALETALSYLNKEGRIVVLSYHSLEDRITKRIFKKHGGVDFEIITKKPLLPSPQEVSENRRARSAKMRVIGRLS